jgi:hypothetical protein
MRLEPRETRMRERGPDARLARAAHRATQAPRVEASEDFGLKGRLALAPLAAHMDRAGGPAPNPQIDPQRGEVVFSTSHDAERSAERDRLLAMTKTAGQALLFVSGFTFMNALTDRPGAPWGWITLALFLAGAALVRKGLQRKGRG